MSLLDLGSFILPAMVRAVLESLPATDAVLADAQVRLPPARLGQVEEGAHCPRAGANGDGAGQLGSGRGDRCATQAFFAVNTIIRLVDYLGAAH